MEKRFILSIDQGTTTTKVILFDHEGKRASTAFREIRQIYPQPGWVEHDPIEYWDTTQACMKEALEKVNAHASDVAAIGITCQRETTVIWDRITGEPVYNAIVWQSRQSADICEDMKAKGYEQAVKEKTGLLIDAYFSSTKIKWIIDNVPGVKAKLAEKRLCMGNIDSWLIWKLSKGACHVEDYSNASRTMLFNINTLQWDPELLNMLDIPIELMPRVLPSSGIMAMTHRDMFFGEEVPIAGDAGDQQAATFGQTCFKPGMAKNTYGTSLALMMNIGDKPIPSKHGMTTDLAWVINGKAEYSFEGVVFVGGATIQWLRDGLKIIKEASEVNELASRVEDTGGVYLVPAFVGLCAPYWDMYARGLIIGITRGTTNEHIARSALEAIAYETRDVLDAMTLDSGVQTTALRVDGGATRSDFLMQFQSDILGISIERPAVAEMAALGAAYLAGMGVGFWSGREEVAKHWKVERTYEPAMSADRRESLYDGWKRAVKRSFEWSDKKA